MNPELQRNLWLEASPRRIGWAAVAFVGVLAAVWLSSDDASASEQLSALGGAGAFIFFAAALVWGVRLAGQSIGSEIGERTWDFQRLSALDPWAMTWGKLFGATALAWAVGGAGLLVATVAYAAQSGPAETLQFFVSAVALAVLLQAAGMAAALVGVRKARVEGRIATLRSAAGGFFSVVFVLFAIGVASSVSNLFFGGVRDFTPIQDADAVRFWGSAVDRNLFVMGSLVAFAGWALVAAWRLMRLELQKQNGPLYWTAFLLFTAFWAAGQATIDVDVTSAEAAGFDPAALARWAAAAVVFLLGAYAAAFAEPADRVRLRRFAAGRDLAHAPAVVPALVFGAVAMAGVLVSLFALSALPDNDEFTRLDLALFVGAVLAFVLRDMAVIAYFRFGPRPKRGDFGAVLALLLLYGLGALVANAVGQAVAVALPNPEAPVVSLISGLLQTVVIGALALRRIRGPETTAAA